MQVLNIIFVLDVSVSLPTVVMVVEGDELVDVCATLSARRIETLINIRLFASKNISDCF